MRPICWTILWALVVLPGFGFAAQPAAKPIDTSRGDRMIAEYFRIETQKLAKRCLNEINTIEDWQSRRDAYRQQLFEMLGLDPLPERTPLNAVVSGRVQQDGFTVEKLHFQSRPCLLYTSDAADEN